MLAGGTSMALEIKRLHLASLRHHTDLVHG